MTSGLINYKTVIMFKNIFLSGFFIFFLLLLSSCKKEEYSFGDIKAPTDLTLTTSIAGADASNPNGNGTGEVVITAAANNALSYNINFGDGTTRMVPSGTVTYKFTNP